MGPDRATCMHSKSQMGLVALVLRVWHVGLCDMGDPISALYSCDISLCPIRYIGILFLQVIYMTEN